jgi:hypothetical protein
MFWVGYTLYFRFFIREKKTRRPIDFDNVPETSDDKPNPDNAAGSGYVPGFGSISRPKYKGTENSGGLMICPICLFKMESGEMVKTKAFPPLTPDSKDRLMHIQGCVYCMDGKRERICPVCGKTISVKDFLIARIFDRSIRRSHVHVLGCTQCRPLKTM